MSDAAGPQPSVDALAAKNARLATALRDARDQLQDLRERMAAMSRPPCTFGVFVEAAPTGGAICLVSGRRMRLAVHPDLDLATLGAGQEVELNEAMTVIAAGRYPVVGETASLTEVLDAERALVVGRGDDERVVWLADNVRGRTLRPGDSVVIDKSGYAIDVLPRAEVAELILEEVPDIVYEDIGGLSEQIEAIRDAVELPFAHPELYREHGLRPPKGVLLYGPPGCGKTLIAKAVASSLARMARDATSDPNLRSYFLNVKGPELLNKYVGETERHIRVIFDRARLKASQGMPVVVFFDEMESLFRTRGTGVSSDVETTIVPQLLAEIDGVERLDNVIVIGASNREDMIDPAILRPGRLDVKIRIERPGANAAREIFGINLTPSLPIHASEIAEAGGSIDTAVAAMIDAAVEYLYRETTGFAAVASGAKIATIVDRAKKAAIKSLLTTGERGLTRQHVLDACAAEMAENAGIAS